MYKSGTLALRLAVIFEVTQYLNDTIQDSQFRNIRYSGLLNFGFFWTFLPDSTQTPPDIVLSTLQSLLDSEVIAKNAPTDD
jgi:hypothetical protein